MLISIIIPVRNEALCIAACLHALQPLRSQNCELIVVDGGSHDSSVALARPLADTVIISPPGRATQMNTGAQCARGAILWFLHVDSPVSYTHLTLPTSDLV